MDLANLNWEKAKQLYDEHHISLEVLWTLGLYVPHIIPAWKGLHSTKSAKIRGLPWIPFVLHVSLGTMLVAHYNYLYWATGEYPEPTVVDFLLAPAFVLSTLYLTTYIAVGVVPVIRASMQATAIQQAFAWTMAFAHGGGGGDDGARWHRAAVKLLNSFMWYRWIAQFGDNFRGFRTYGAKFTGGIILAHPITLWEGNYPAGYPTYAAVVLALLAVDEWASRKLDGKPGFVPRVLVQFGLVTTKKVYGESDDALDEHGKDEDAELKQE